MTQVFKEVGFTEELGALIKGGFPTFDEFRKNPDKYKGHYEEVLASMDEARSHLSSRTKTVKHKWRDEYEVESLEQLQRIMKLEGFTEKDVSPEPKARSLGGTGKDERFEITIRWWPNDEYRLKGGIVENE